MQFEWEKYHSGVLTWKSRMEMQNWRRLGWPNPGLLESVQSTHSNNSWFSCTNILVLTILRFFCKLIFKSLHSFESQFGHWLIKASPTWNIPSRSINAFNSQMMVNTCYWRRDAIARTFVVSFHVALGNSLKYDCHINSITFRQSKLKWVKNSSISNWKLRIWTDYFGLRVALHLQSGSHRLK